MNQPKYLVRPHDYCVFEIDPSNGCYRGYEKTIKENRQTAYKHFNLENLTENYDFFEIEESELESYLEKNSFHMKFRIWQGRSDGHGGSEGGEMPEYLEYLERVKRWEKRKADGSI